VWSLHYINFAAQWNTKVVIIKLHAPTNSTQKLKLMGRGGQFTYTSTVMREKNLNIESGELYLSSSFSIEELDHVFLLVKLQARKGCWDLLGITWDLCHL